MARAAVADAVPYDICGHLKRSLTALDQAKVIAGNLFQNWDKFPTLFMDLKGLAAFEQRSQHTADQGLTGAAAQLAREAFCQNRADPVRTA